MVCEVKMNVVNLYTVKKTILIILVASVFVSCKCNDVLGCNGFIKSDIDINFSLVEVKLLVIYKFLSSFVKL